MTIANLIVAADTWNPFDGINPNFGPFAPLLESRVDKIVALVWVCALAYLGAQLIINMVAFGKAKRGRYGKELDEAKADMIWNGAALVGVAAVGSIYAVLVAF